MALSFSQKLRISVSNKAYRIYEVTPDGSTTTIDANDLDLNYIDYAIAHGKLALSGAADQVFLSTASGNYITFGEAYTASNICVVEAWGY